MIRIFAVPLLTAVMVSAAPAADKDDLTILARVGSETITAADLYRLIEGRRLISRNTQSDQERVAALLEELIVEKLVSVEAPRISLANRPRVTARIRRAIALQAGERFDWDYLIPQLRIDSVTIDSFYQEHISRYTASRNQRRIRHITLHLAGRSIPENYSSYVDPVYEGWDPERKIDSIYVRLADGEDFTSLAHAHSEEPHSKGAGGDIGWVSEHSLAPGTFADTCLSLPLYKISRPFQSELGWHIVQVTAMRSAGPVPIDAEIASDIARLLAKDQSAAFVKRISDSVTAAATLEIFDAALAISDDALDPGTPLAVVNERDTIYAAEYLIDKDSWQSRYGGSPLTPDQKREIISVTYFGRTAWNGMLRDLGYFDGPEIQDLLRQQENHERGNIVRLHLSSADVIPDSAAIIAYYESHRQEFANPPLTLRQAWSRIRNIVRTQVQDNARRERVAELERRHGVTRHPRRLAAITIPDRR